MSKINEIDLSGDRLIAIAADMVDSHNYIGALKMLNKNAEIAGNDEDSLMLYAEIFDDLGMYERCVNGWFKYMDETLGGDLNDCYEGLAVSFMNLGNEQFSAYYYNKLLFETGGLDSETREEIVKDFLSTDANPLKFAYPPALADCSDIMMSGIDFMRTGEYDRASEEFEKVEEGNEKYAAARNYIAMCKIIADRTEEAEQECLSILEKHPQNVQALTTLAAVKTEAGKTNEALALAKRLLSLNVTDNDEIYKIATVCCENKMHAEAYNLFSKLSDESAYDLSVMYFKAVSAFNSGKYEDSFNEFDTLLTLYPNALTARHYYYAARDMVEEGNVTELTYFYRLPQETRERLLKILTAYISLPQSAAKQLSGDKDVYNAVQWGFDESEYKSGELQTLAAQVAVKAGFDEFLREILLNAFLSDQLKIDVLTELAERGVEDAYGVVICNIYKQVSMRGLSLGRRMRKNFVRAYARLVGHFSILNDSHGEKFATAAEELYAKLFREDRIEDAKNVSILTAAIYILSGVKEAGLSGKKLYSFFDVKEEQVKKLTD